MARETISRRTFLSGAALATGAAALGGAMAGCAPLASTNSNNVGSNGTGQSGDARHSWEIIPDAITEFARTVETEVVVIGAGLAGLSTACSAAEQGSKVVVVEKTGSWNGRSAGFGAVKSRALDAYGYTVDKEAAQAVWIRTCASRCNQDLVSLYFDKSEESANWVLDKCDKAGSTVIIGDFLAAMNSKLYPEEPTYHIVSGGEGVEEGTFATGALLYNDSLAAGAEYVFNSPAVQLIVEDGAVKGCVCESDEGYVAYRASKGTVLAAGDIHGNAEMVESFCPECVPIFDKSIYTPVGANTGDGHKMGMWAGAVLQDLPLPPMIHPQLYCEASPPFLAVNSNGARFFNEGTWLQGRSLSILKQPDQLCYYLLDANWHEYYMEGLSVGGGIFWDGFQDYDAAMAKFDDYIERGIAWKADSLDELARKIDVDSETLAATVDRYNDLCAKGVDEDYRKDPVLMTPCNEGPFIALKVGAALLAIVGGLKVNTDSQCLNAEGDAIPGLFAVGNCQGDLYASDYPINIVANSHGRCVTFGYLLGRHFAEM